MEQKAGDAARMPEFAHYVTMQVLQSSLQDGKVGQPPVSGEIYHS